MVHHFRWMCNRCFFSNFSIFFEGQVFPMFGSWHLSRCFRSCVRESHWTHSTRSNADCVLMAGSLSVCCGWFCWLVCEALVCDFEQAFGDDEFDLMQCFVLTCMNEALFRLSHPFAILEWLFRLLWMVGSVWRQVFVCMCQSSIVGCFAVKRTCSTFAFGTKIVDLYSDFHCLWEELVFLQVFDMSLFIHACAMISVCQKDVIREHARWRHNFAPSQSDLEVLSVRSTWDVWAFIFLFSLVMFDKESPISCFFVMSTVFVSFFNRDHYLFWNGRVVWHIVPGTHSFVQHVASVWMSDVKWQSAWEDSRSDNSLDGLFLPEFWWFMCVLWVIGGWTCGHFCWLCTRDAGHDETWCHGHH